MLLSPFQNNSSFQIFILCSCIMLHATFYIVTTTTTCMSTCQHSVSASHLQSLCSIHTPPKLSHHQMLYCCWQCKLWCDVEVPAGKGFAAVEVVLEAAAANNFGGDPALAALAMTGDLIEQYLHPSNNGQCVFLHCTAVGVISTLLLRIPYIASYFIRLLFSFNL